MQDYVLKKMELHEFMKMAYNLKEDEMMELSEFKKKVSIVEEDEKHHIREIYCSSFLNVSSAKYEAAINKKHEYSDGLYYNGYMWDYLSSPVIVESDYLTEKVRGRSNIYVLWDIHSCEKVFIENYWNFGRDDVLLLDGNTLMDAFYLLPEDIYIFDSSYMWTAIFTHEDIEGRRYCLESQKTL